ncbi:MAG: HDIG domain-containing protein [Candidatus Berkelbacteria bacterium]|nr:HDIG domain-containing protein [Candidatus Berkelbacteria bacterium]
MEKSLRSSILIIGSIFLINFMLAILAVFFADALDLKVAFLLFLASIISSAIAITVIGGYFTSLSTYLIHIRRLYKLNNLTNPLLLRLSKEAPGTYHHSVLVADLTSKAAKAVGVDSMLCRVSSYFHDIGKLKNPTFFIENQGLMKETNNHSSQEKSPTQKAKIVIDHVRDGIKMARDAHLPMEVINMIAQHHGNSLCSYFYEEAKEKDSSRIKKSDFRYDGPKSQTKEAAILMLADSIEAVARVKNNSVDNKKLVEDIFLDKESEKQLDDCGFSLRELATLKNTFADTLNSMHHLRIEYP